MPTPEPAATEPVVSYAPEATPVLTEPVERVTPVEPVRARRKGVNAWILAAVVAGLIMIAAGAGYWGSTVTGELDRTRTTIASRDTSISEVDSSVASTQEKTNGEKSRTAVAEDEIARLHGLSAKKVACITAQGKDFDELRRIFEEQKENFDRTATGSKFAKADAAAWKAAETAMNDVENSYKSVAGGSITRANSWLSKAIAQTKIIDAKIKVINKEVKAINSSTDATNAALDALGAKLDATARTCGA